MASTAAHALPHGSLTLLLHPEDVSRPCLAVPARKVRSRQSIAHHSPSRVRLSASPASPPASPALPALPASPASPALPASPLVCLPLSPTPHSSTLACCWHATPARYPGTLGSYPTKLDRCDTLRGSASTCSTLRGSSRSLRPSCTPSAPTSLREEPAPRSSRLPGESAPWEWPLCTRLRPLPELYIYSRAAPWV